MYRSNTFQQALGSSHALHYVIVPRGTLDQYYDTDAHLIAPLNQVFGELVYEGEIRVQVNPEPFLGQHRPEGIHTTKLAWQETVKKEIELNKALLSTFHVRFSEGYGLSGAQVSKYADVLAAATIENSHSRRESELPSTPEQIRLAILEVTKLAVAKHDDDVTFELLKMAYSSLARFLPEPEAQLVAARNIAWLSEDPNHPPFERSADAEQIDASVEADESQLADEFDQLVAKVKEKQKIQEELEWLRNEKAKVIRQKAKLELELSKAFRDLNPDDPDAIMEDLLEEFRSSDVREGSAGKYCGDALVAWRKGDRETAFDLFTNAIELDSDDPVTLLNRGNLQLEMGRFEAGIEDLERAREMAPELPCVNADIMKMLDAEEREDWRQQMLKKHRPE